MNVVLSIALLVAGIFVFGAALLVPTAHAEAATVGDRGVSPASGFAPVDAAAAAFASRRAPDHADRRASDGRAAAVVFAPAEDVDLAEGEEARVRRALLAGKAGEEVDRCFVADDHLRVSNVGGRGGMDETTACEEADISEAVSSGLLWRRRAARDDAPAPYERALGQDDATGLSPHEARATTGDERVASVGGDATIRPESGSRPPAGLFDAARASDDGRSTDADDADVSSAVERGDRERERFDERTALRRAQAAVGVDALLDVVQRGTLAAAVEAASDLRARAGVDALDAVLRSLEHGERAAQIRRHLPLLHCAENISQYRVVNA